MILSSLGVVLLFLSDFLYVEAQTQSQEIVSSQDVSNFQPGLGVLMGVLSITFLLTCILLVYARFFVDRRSSTVTPGNHLTRSASWSSGIEKSVIESLPFFRFSSLRGLKEGLECSVCLSRFEDVETLRLLPQCKHAFHVGCIDRWLEGHSSCPLCRQRMDPEDPRIFSYSNSMRSLLRNYSQSVTRDDVGSETELQPYIQREVEESRWPSRLDIGSSLRRLFGGGKNVDESVSVRNGATDCRDQHSKVLHRFNHRILVPQVIFNNRWSDVRSSDLMFLNSEMINAESNNKLFDSRSDARRPEKSVQLMAEDHVITIREEMELKRSLERKILLNNETASPLDSDAGKGLHHGSKLLMQDEKRSMSEITSLSRFAGLNLNGGCEESSSAINDDEVTKRDRTRRLWLPIAKRTVQWFANREKRSEEPQNQFSENTRNV